MGKYRIKLGNGRIVGPLSKGQIGELFLKRRINGKESYQEYPDGEFKSLKEFSELKEVIKNVIKKKEVSSQEDNDNTIARIKIDEKKEDLNPTEKNEEEVLQEENEFSEFKYSKETQTKIDYQELEEKFKQNTPKEEIEKTQLIRIPTKFEESEEIEKTVLVHREDLEVEDNTEPEENEEEDLPEEEEVVENPPEIVDVDEKTGFVNLKDVISDIKDEVQETERVIEEKLKNETEVDNTEPEPEPVEEVPEEDKKKKKRQLIIVGLIVILALVLFDFGSGNKKVEKPLYANFEFPVGNKEANLEKSKELFEKGINLYVTGSYLNRLKSSIAFKKSLTESYDDNPALGMLVRVYSELLPEAKEQKKAKKTIFRLIQISRNKILNDPNLTLGIAKFYSYLNKFSSARRTIENYIRLNKPDLDIFTYYLYVLVESGDYINAKKIYKRLEGIKEKLPSTYLYMSHFLRANENYEEQRELLKKAVELQPNSVKLWLALCSNLFEDGEYALLNKALDNIKKLKMERSPHFYSKYLEYRGMLRALNGNLDEAGKFLLKALKYRDSNELRSKLATLELEGTEVIQKLIQESKIKDSMRKAKLAVREKKWEEAFRYSIKAVDLNEAYIPSQLLLADIQTKRGYFQAALETTELLKKDYPANPDAAFTYIYTLLQAEKLDEANLQINLLSDTTKFFLISKFQALIGYYWLKRNSFNFANQYFQMAIKKDPLNDEYYFVLAKEFFKRKRFKDAKKFLSKCLELDPDNVYYMSLLGNIFYEMEDAKTAIGYLRDTLKLYPDHPKLLGDIAVYYYRSGKVKEFEEYKEKLENLRRKDGDFYSFMIKASKLEDSDKGVIEYSKKLIQTDPGNLKTRMVLGEFLLKTNKNNEALKEFSEVVKRLNTYPKIHYNLAKVYINLRDYPKAIKSAEEEIKQNPSLPYGHYIAGEIYRLQGEYAKATPYFEMAISKNARLVPALMGLGFIKYRNNLYEQARQFYLKAQKEQPNNPEIHKQLGFIFNASGQSSLAAESFETYLRLYPGAPDKLEIEKYIRALR